MFQQSMGQIHTRMKIITITAGFLGLTGVTLGAFGAHALEATLAASGRTEVWKTAVLYHLLHAVALLAINRGHVETGHQNSVIGGLWGVGVLLFSGSLYLLCVGGPRWLGPVTPLGGLLLIAGWGIVFMRGLRGKGIA